MASTFNELSLEEKNRWLKTLQSQKLGTCDTEIVDYVTALLILLNPYNLIALYFAFSGLAMWGSEENYKIDSFFFTLFRLFGVPTLAFAFSWIGIRKWRKFNYWKMYLSSFVISLVLIFIVSQIYWGIVGRK